MNVRIADWRLEFLMIWAQSLLAMHKRYAIPCNGRPLPKNDAQAFSDHFQIISPEHRTGFRPISSNDPRNGTANRASRSRVHGAVSIYEAE